jgi:hypothetical protein
MKKHIHALLPLFSTVTLVAQAPASPTPAAAPTLAQRFSVAQPEVDRLINELKPREALVRAETILPATVEPFNKDDLKGALDSFNRNGALIRAYSLAGKAAFASGYWDKALDYDTKAGDLAKQNYEDTKSTLVPAAANLRSMIVQNKKTLEDSASYIEELKAKPNPDPGDKQQLDLVEGLKSTIISNEKWAKICDEDVEMAKKTMDYFAPKADETREWIKKEAEQLASYRYPNNKVKYVDGIISSAKFMAQFQDKQSKIQYLYRLNVLDPDNRKVQREIEVLQGRAAAEPKHSGKK